MTNKVLFWVCIITIIFYPVILLIVIVNKVENALEKQYEMYLEYIDTVPPKTANQTLQAIKSSFDVEIQ